MLTGSVSD
jgi:hypothetical protein